MDRDAVWIGSLIIAVIMGACLYYIYQRRNVVVSALSPKEKWALCGAKAFTSGLFSGTTGFCVKSTIEVVTTAIGQERYSEFARWQFWIIALCLPISLGCQIGFLNSALRQFDAMMVVPIYQSMIVLAGVGFGWLYFNEASGQPTISIVMFIVGCLITVVGILLLALKVMRRDSYEKVKTGDDQEATEAGHEAFNGFLKHEEATPLDDISVEARLVHISCRWKTAFIPDNFCLLMLQRKRATYKQVITENGTAFLQQVATVKNSKVHALDIRAYLVIALYFVERAFS